MRTLKICRKLWIRWGSGRQKIEMKLNPSKFKAVRFTKARVKGPLNYTLGDQLIPEASSCKYLGIILHSNLNWTDHVNYTVEKDRKGIHFIMYYQKFSLHYTITSDS
jgi:hypothetical protein